MAEVFFYFDIRYAVEVHDWIIEKDADGYFVASVPSLPGCHTQAKFWMS